jgi:hypothetical protein
VLYLNDNGVLTIPTDAVNTTYTIDLKRYAGEALSYNLMPFFIGGRYVSFNLPTSDLSDGQYKLELKLANTVLYIEDLRVNLPRKGIGFIAPEIAFKYVAPTFIEGNWILTGGTWSDIGVWIDTATWID